MASIGVSKGGMGSEVPGKYSGIEVTVFEQDAVSYAQSLLPTGPAILGLRCSVLRNAFDRPGPVSQVFRLSLRLGGWDQCAAVVAWDTL